ncbi:hypothetical protein PRIPAC_76212 [Pristionchus pacificus]|uniref:Uncharacterized protein n=1 Tax=Pristionchus pacificus TaxID=54126 RepID=A0A454XSB7_PRIPA|nr:hypothetical protein PRIPAC_76212 [Pristionchus pacificus]|eukprot:PDM68428.1 hypothetical protein PRIPAC_43930 [Pristionchus pacificus]
MLLLVLIVGVGITVGVEVVTTTLARIPLNSCYISNTTSTPYDVLERVNREAAAQKDCELLCDSQSSCSGIAFKEGSDISCVLLSTAKLDKVCSAPTTILHKQTEGCAGPSEPSTSIAPPASCLSECDAGKIWIDDPYVSELEHVFCPGKDLSDSPQFQWDEIQVLSLGIFND